MEHRAEGSSSEKVLMLLHVDDNDDDRFLVAHSISHLPIKLKAVASGAEALGTLAKADRLPDVIALDIRMPLMSGFQVLEQIRSSHRFSGIPVIMFSNSTYMEDIRQAHRLGANSYCVKPGGMAEYKQLFFEIYNSWLNSEAPNYWPPNISFN